MSIDYNERNNTQLAEHNIKIANLESITRDNAQKLDKILAEIQQLKLDVIGTRCPAPGTCLTIGARVDSIERKIKDDIERKIKDDIEPILTDLSASKNKIIGAMTLGSIFGTVIGVLGTWVVEFFKK